MTNKVQIVTHRLAALPAVVDEPVLAGCTPVEGGGGQSVLALAARLERWRRALEAGRGLLALRGQQSRAGQQAGVSMLSETASI